MRIVGGVWRGRKIAEPSGRDVTRPTTDRVREACASIVNSALEEGIEGALVLDAFGGSGALGIEMLSRGAAHATLFDLDRRAATLIRRNLESLDADRGSWTVACGDVLTAAARGKVPGGPFDVVLIDPPYALGPGPAEQLLEALAAHGLIAPGAVVLSERSSELPAPVPAGFTCAKSKRYGGTTVDVLLPQPSPDQEGTA